MQVQSVNPKSNVNFNSAEVNNKATAFVNMSDSQLRLAACVSGRDKKQEKKNKNSLLRTLYAIPVIDTIASAVLVNKSSKLSDEAVTALRKTRLTTRINRAAGTAAFWAISLSAIELYNVVKKSIEAKSPTLRKIDKENPATSFLLDITAILGGGSLAIAGLNKLTKNLKTKHPDQYDAVNKYIRKARVLVHKSKFNKEVLPKLAESAANFAEKFPTAAKASRWALANSVLILFGIGIGKVFAQSKNERNRIESNYRNLKETQLQVSKQLINNLHNEKKSLVEEVAELKEAAFKKNRSIKEDFAETRDEMVEDSEAYEETSAAETDSETSSEAEDS